MHNLQQTDRSCSPLPTSDSGFQLYPSVPVLDTQLFSTEFLFNQSVFWGSHSSADKLLALARWKFQPQLQSVCLNSHVHFFPSQLATSSLSLLQPLYTHLPRGPTFIPFPITFLFLRSALELSCSSPRSLLTPLFKLFPTPPPSSVSLSPYIFPVPCAGFLSLSLSCILPLKQLLTSFYSSLPSLVCSLFPHTHPDSLFSLPPTSSFPFPPILASSRSYFRVLMHLYFCASLTTCRMWFYFRFQMYTLI